MRSKILAPLAVVALALTASSTSSAQQAPSSAPPPAPAASASASFSTSGVSASGPSSDADPKKTILPIVVGGLGAAQLITGIVLLAAAPSMPDNCDEATRTCSRKPGQSEASFNQDQQDAGDSQQMNAFGLIGVSSGAVFLVAGAAMYLWYNRDPSKTASTKPVVVPYAGTNGGGLAAVATF